MIPFLLKNKWYLFILYAFLQWYPFIFVCIYISHYRRKFHDTVFHDKLCVLLCKFKLFFCRLINSRYFGDKFLPNDDSPFKWVSDFSPFVIKFIIILYYFHIFILNNSMDSNIVCLIYQLWRQNFIIR